MKDRIMSKELDIKHAEISRILAGRDEGLVAIVGPCANQKSRKIIHEGVQLAKMATTGLATVHRIPSWKPRTPVMHGPKPWEGLHDSNCISALSRTLWERRKGVHIAFEVKDREHLAHYRNIGAFVWLGARSIGNEALNALVARSDMALTPVGVKNELTGSTATALERIKKIEKLRRNKVGMPGTVSLLFRGGSALQTPHKWEDAYKRAMHATQGRMIVDVAHGSEMAHDPSGNFNKTVLGQMACLDHVLSLAQDGWVPRGIMIEASDVTIVDPSRQTDPNMPFKHALDAVQELHAITMQGVTV